MAYTDRISADANLAEDDFKHALNRKKVLCITRKCGRIDKTLKKETDEGFMQKKSSVHSFFLSKNRKKHRKELYL